MQAGLFVLAHQAGQSGAPTQTPYQSSQSSPTGLSALQGSMLSSAAKVGALSYKKGASSLHYAGGQLSRASSSAIKSTNHGLAPMSHTGSYLVHGAASLGASGFKSVQRGVTSVVNPTNLAYIGKGVASVSGEVGKEFLHGAQVVGSSIKPVSRSGLKLIMSAIH